MVIHHVWDIEKYIPFGSFCENGDIWTLLLISFKENIKDASMIQIEI